MKTETYRGIEIGAGKLLGWSGIRWWYFASSRHLGELTRVESPGAFYTDATDANGKTVFATDAETILGALAACKRHLGALPDAQGLV